MIRSSARAALGVALVLGLAVAQTGAAAQSDDASRRALSIARTTQSPFCPGKTLDACPSPAAGAWRQEIRGWVAEGVETEVIRARLQARVPHVDLSGKPLGDTSWLLPVVAIGVVTLGFAVWMFRLWERPRDRTAPTAAAEAGADERDPANQGLDLRLQEELARLEG